MSEDKDAPKKVRVTLECTACGRERVELSGFSADLLPLVYDWNGRHQHDPVPSLTPGEGK